MQGTLFVVVQFVNQYANGFDRVVSDLAFNFPSSFSICFCSVLSFIFKLIQSSVVSVTKLTQFASENRTAENTCISCILSRSLNYTIPNNSRVYLYFVFVFLQSWPVVACKYKRSNLAQQFKTIKATRQQCDKEMRDARHKTLRMTQVNSLKLPANHINTHSHTHTIFHSHTHTQTLKSVDANDGCPVAHVVAVSVCGTSI